jgi:uncharacterized protein YdaU (DUF1376 family)
MTARPWMKFYPADFIGDTQHLSAEQLGAYMALICHYWLTGKLPTDEAKLARIAKIAPTRWKRHRDVLRAFFSDDWKHKRIEREIARSNKKRTEYENDDETGTCAH